MQNILHGFGGKFKISPDSESDMRIVFIGTVEFSKIMLEKLIELDANVVGIFTSKSNSINADFADLTILSQSNNIPLRRSNLINSRQSLDWIREKRPDILFCFGWSRLLKSEVLSLAPMGVLGYHPAELPKNRGRHPLIWALALGLTHTASTFFFMDEGADSGDILSQYPIQIESTDDAADLYKKMVDTASSQLVDFLPQLQCGNYPRESQNHELANVWRKREKRDGEVDWRMGACEVHNLIRALARPYVGAHFVYNQKEYKIWKARIVEFNEPNIEPGKVLQGGQCPVVACSRGALQILQIEPDLTLTAGEYL